MNIANIIGRNSSVLNKLTPTEIAQLRTVSKSFKSVVDTRSNITKKLKQKKKFYDKVFRRLTTRPSKHRSDMSAKNLKLGKMLLKNFGGIKRNRNGNYVTVPVRRTSATNYIRNINDAARILNRILTSNKNNVNRNNNNGMLYFKVGGREYNLSRNGYLRIQGSSGIRGVTLNNIFTPNERRKIQL